MGEGFIPCLQTGRRSVNHIVLASILKEQCELIRGFTYTGGEVQCTPPEDLKGNYQEDCAGHFLAKGNAGFSVDLDDPPRCEKDTKFCDGEISLGGTTTIHLQ